LGHSGTFLYDAADRAAGRLSREMPINSGAADPLRQLPNSYGGPRPDVRLSLGSSGHEAVWDFTTIREAGATGGHAGQYASKGFVEYAADLPYERP
jgi:hypothetical protein